jgi:uncharacterized protein YeaO (DUF488 family)
MVRLKRAYEPASREDGYRVLVERLWPRGLRKQDLVLDAWERVVAPSHDLRKWFAHDPDRWPEFKQRYRQELRDSSASEHVHALAERASQGTVTLVFSTHDAMHSSALVLKEVLDRVVQHFHGHAEHQPGA